MKLMIVRYPSIMIFTYCYFAAPRIQNQDTGDPGRSSERVAVIQKGKRKTDN